MNTKPLSSKPQLLEGEARSDERGSVRFINSFNFAGIKRFYHVRNATTKVIRAFHGHIKEAKYVYVVRGKILLAFVKLTNAHNPSPKEKVQLVTLSDDKPSIQYIPPGYANGFKVLKEHSDVIFFSTSTLEESKQDDFRFDPYYWGKEVWD